MKRAWVVLGLVAGLGLLATEASAQHGSARGKVVDEKGEPVKDAKIEIEYLGGVTQKYETKTDKKGEYIQVGMRPGQYRITATKEGFQGTYVEFRISLGEPTQIPEMTLTSASAARQQAGVSRAAEIEKAFKEALELTQAEKWDEAEAGFKKILETAPSVPEAHYNLGYIYSKKQDWPNAEVEFQKAIELKPDYGEAYVALARAYQDSGQKDKADEILNKAQQSAEGTGSAAVHFNLGINHLNAGQSAEAAEDFERAIAADPSYAEAYFHLGTIKVGQNDIPKAVEYLEKYLSLDPTNAQNVATAQGLLQALKPK
jgi:Tfp pilus assembly protein PilF